MNRVKVAVVGVGALGQHHARILSTMENVELVGVVDSREQQGRSIAAKHQTQWFATAEEVRPLVDGVVIAVPTVLHYEVARPFLEAGIAVMIEKPLADGLEAARALQGLATFRGTVLQVGHVERFNPAFEILQQRVQQPMYIRCQRVSPYTFRSTDIGVVHDLMIGAVTIGPNEDMAVARLRTSSGVIADITASRMNPTAERTIQVWGRSGFVSADLQTRKVSVWQPNPLLAERPTMVHDIVAATPNPLTLKDEVFTKWINNEQLQGSAADALTAELLDFVHCIKTGSRPRVSGDAAVKAMEVADRVLAGMPKFSWQTGAMPDAVRKAA